jgi:hypothetical protein
MEQYICIETILERKKISAPAMLYADTKPPIIGTSKKPGKRRTAVREMQIQSPDSIKSKCSNPRMQVIQESTIRVHQDKYPCDKMSNKTKEKRAKTEKGAYHSLTLRAPKKPRPTAVSLIPAMGAASSSISHGRRG